MAEPDVPLDARLGRGGPDVAEDRRSVRDRLGLGPRPELRAAGVVPPSRQLMVMLLGGLRELIATTVEDDGDIGGITELAVRATQALLDPSRREVSRGR